MDAGMQTLFNIVVALAGVLGGWLLKIIYDSIKQLRERDQAIEERVDVLQKEFLRRDDFRDFVHRIEGTLIRIEAKLDSKVDK